MCHAVEWQEQWTFVEKITTPDIYVLRDNKLLVWHKQKKKKKYLCACECFTIFIGSD